MRNVRLTKEMFADQEAFEEICELLDVDPEDTYAVTVTVTEALPETYDDLLPESEHVFIDDLDYEDGDDLDEAISDYLSDKYGFCINGFCIESTDTTTGEIYVTEIDWDTTE